MLKENDLQEALAQLHRARGLEWPRMAMIRSYMRNEACDIYVPKEATREYKMLVDQARFNVMPLVVTAVAQNLYVDGFRPTRPDGRAPTSENSPIWDKVWQPNRMDARQAGIYRAALTYGYSYNIVLPGESPLTGEKVPNITPWSPLRLTALYEDPVNDEWPRFAMTVEHANLLTGQELQHPMLASSHIGPIRVKLYDENHIYTFEIERQGSKVTPRGESLKVEEHGLGVTPVVRFIDQYDLEGASFGKIEPLLPAQRQLNQTTFNLLMTQQYSSFRQRWATGMAIEEDENGNPKEPWNSAVNTVWQNESPNGNFGEFSESNLSGYLDSRDKVLLYIASTGQIPPHNLLVGSGISNISAEGLAMIEAGHRQDIQEHQTCFGEGLEQTLRLAGRACGDDETWKDTSAQVVWRDTTPRSLAQVIDALGKMATMLGIPVQALWERIPGVTDQDIARWIEMKSQATVMDELKAMLRAEGTEVPDQEPAAEEETAEEDQGEFVAAGSDNGSTPG